MSLLELKEVHRTYTRGPEHVHALRGASLAVDAGSIVVVIGSSGSGKTTLLNLAAGLDRPTTGEVFFNGGRIDRLPERAMTAWRRRHVGMIFQDFHLVEGLTAEQNVRLPLLFSTGPDNAVAMMERAEIAQRRMFHPRHLSGGERQRVAIARALIHSPELLLADEPTGNLDSEQAGRIFDLFRSLAASTRLAILIATHNEELARRADHRVRLKDGLIESIV